MREYEVGDGVFVDRPKHPEHGGPRVVTSKRWDAQHVRTYYEVDNSGHCGWAAESLRPANLAGCPRVTDPAEDGSVDVFWDVGIRVYILIARIGRDGHLTSLISADYKIPGEAFALIVETVAKKTAEFAAETAHPLQEIVEAAARLHEAEQARDAARARVEAAHFEKEAATNAMLAANKEHAEYGERYRKLTTVGYVLAALK